MPRQSLQYAIRAVALEGIASNNTRRTYARSIRYFVAWAKEHEIKRLDQVDAAVLQAYSDALQADPRQYSPDTIHAKLAPICKAAGVPMYNIRKPKRISADNTRGRSGRVRSDREIEQERFARVVKLQAAVGCRRAELAALTGADLIDGGAGVRIRSGKGGKSTVQYILPEDRATVAEIFAGIGEDEKVFTTEEMGNRINLHGMRAGHAQRVYNHFVQLFARQPSSRAEVAEDLIRRWDAGHVRLKVADRRAWQTHREAFIAEVTSTKPYIIRGANAALARKNGRPVEYDRLALMAASVLALSHWRLNVTINNYMLY